MRLSLLLSLSLAVFAWRTAEAQLAPADDFFNSGAQLYISNNIPAALDRVELGLKTYPDDEKLKKLEQLLKQQQQQQNQQKQEQQSQSQKDQQKQNQPQKSPEQQKQDEQKQADEKKQADQKKSGADKQNDQKPEEKQGEGQPAGSAQMTPAEAKRLLEAQKGDEKMLQIKPPGKPPDSQKPVKDW